MTRDADAARAVRIALDAGVGDGTTPGAAALVFSPGGRLVHTTGALHGAPGAAAVDADTVFDLASLTKLLSTTLLVARAVDDGRLALDEQPWPRWPGVTVEHVLRHEAGLPAWLPLFEETRQKGGIGLPAGKALVEEAARAAAPEAAPGARTLYSDIGIIALGALIEERSGRALDALFAEAAQAAYGETGLRFVRLAFDGYHPAVPNVAPTERCPWRRRALFGQVHDENAFAMGGVAGHAGLFGSLLDVEAAARALLDAVGDGGGAGVPARLRSFASVPGGARRPIGFDKASPGGSTGDALSPRTVGHLAFTGCSLWVDPDDGAAYVLLTNRVHATRDGPQKIRALRQRFHRAAAAWVRSEPSSG